MKRSKFDWHHHQGNHSVLRLTHTTKTLSYTLVKYKYKSRVCVRAFQQCVREHFSRVNASVSVVSVKAVRWGAREHFSSAHENVSVVSECLPVVVWECFSGLWEVLVTYVTISPSHRWREPVLHMWQQGVNEPKSGCSLHHSLWLFLTRSLWVDQRTFFSQSPEWQL